MHGNMNSLFGAISWTGFPAMGCETLVCHYEPASKCQSIEWKYHFPGPRIQVCLPPAKHVDAVLGLEHYQDHRQSVVHSIVLRLERS
jgi:hypothetical protein